MSRSKSDPLEVPGQLGPLFGRTDPQTSRQSAERIAPVLGGAQKVALSWVTSNPGRTAKELGDLAAAYYGADKEAMRQRIGRRLNELERAGLIRWEGERDGCRVWWPVEQP